MGRETGGGSSRLQRLAAARTALERAEERAGVVRPGGGGGPLTASALPALLPAPGAGRARDGEEADAWEGAVASLVAGESGTRTVVGSACLLLAAAARRQGRGWCAVVGGQDVGWCAAHEVGLALERTLVVPLGDVPDAQVPGVLTQVLGILVGAVDVIVLTGSAARLVPGGVRRRAQARARERGTLLVLDSAWERARVLRAEPVAAAGPSLWEGQPEEPGPVADRGAARAVTWTESRAGGEAEDGTGEMPAGYLYRLGWRVSDPRTRPGQETVVTQDAAGLSHQPGRAPSRPRLTVVTAQEAAA